MKVVKNVKGDNVNLPKGKYPKTKIPKGMISNEEMVRGIENGTIVPLEIAWIHYTL
jgi:hypothetical protein